MSEVKIETILGGCNQVDGWVSFIEFGAALIKNGFNYKASHGRLLDFIKSEKNLDWKREQVGEDGQFFVCIKDNKPTSTAKEFAQPKDKAVYRANPLQSRLNQARYALKDFGIIDLKKALPQLATLALNERWYYDVQDAEQPYPILENYLRYTFYRLQQEEGKIVKNDDFACFNTGLVDRRYEPIYALYKKVVHNQTGEDTWLFRSFCIAGEDTDGKNLVRNFRELPNGPHYFDNILDIIYDTKADKPQLDLQHIIVENVSRLPDAFLDENWPVSFTKRDTDAMSMDERNLYFRALGQALVEDSKTYRSLNYRIKDAVDLAVKRVQWNFKTAIPVYFPTRNQMSLLLPLSLIDDETVDIALVVERTASGSYLGHTIISLEWAYKCARLVARPDSDWLSAERISDEQIPSDDILDVLE